MIGAKLRKSTTMRTQKLNEFFFLLPQFECFVYKLRERKSGYFQLTTHSSILLAYHPGVTLCSYKDGKGKYTQNPHLLNTLAKKPEVMQDQHY